MGTSKQKLYSLALWSRLSGLLGRLERVPRDPIPRLRVALVKSTTFADLYCANGSSDAVALLESTWHRTGPLGLFTLFDGTFFLVKQENDPESTIWKDKIQGWKDAHVWQDRQRVFADQEKQAVSATSIDWGEFDLVIALENAVPARITRQFPGTFWAAMIEHHRQPQYWHYRRRPPAGYDVFLNQLIGPNPLTLFRCWHDIEWPYHFTPPDLFPALFPGQPKGAIAYLENHQLVEPAQRAGRDAGIDVLHLHAQSAGDLVREAVKTSYFLAPGAPRPVYGSAFVDAAAAGALIIGNRDRLFNPNLMLAAMHQPDQKCFDTLRRLANNPSELQSTLERQQQQVEANVIHRPVKQLLAAARRVSRELRLHHA